MPVLKRINPSNRPRLKLEVRTGRGQPTQHFPEKSVVLGRDEDCDIPIEHGNVSRRHAEVYIENSGWWVRDLGSSNGTYMNGKAVNKERLSGRVSFTLARDGPEVIATVDEVAQNSTPPPKRMDEYYLGSHSSDEGAGDRTIFIRKALKDVRRKHRYTVAIVVVASLVLLAVLGYYAWQQRGEARRQRDLAQELFYSLKSDEVAAAKSESSWLASDLDVSSQEIERSRIRQAERETRYEMFLKEIGLYTNQLPEEDRLILRVTRIFGECEIGMPDNYVDEVKRYIGYWRKTDRLRKAITLAEAQGYAPRITDALLAQNLPPQFFYLALQESNFDPYSSGPQTHKGIAKGMWQFIPETAVKYGLSVGPLADLRRRDPADERQDFEKSTDAAARYLKFIYSTEAEASALLVMASYNWGEENVTALIRQLPPNPRDRNFWKLLEHHRDRVPQETYDYVFYIVSAAVIGENPQLFGFSFQNPLRHLDVVNQSR